MAWGFVQSKSASGGGVTTLTATLGSSPVTGHKVIVYVGGVTAQAGTGLTYTVADGNSNALTALNTPVTVTSTFTFAAQVFAYDVPASTSTAFKVTCTPSGGASNVNVTILVQEVSGLLAGNTTAMLDGTPGTHQASASPSSATYSSTAVNEYLFTFFSDWGTGATATVPSGYTADTNNVAGSSLADNYVGYKNSTNGSEANSWTWNTSDEVGIITGAFKLAGAGGTTAVPQAYAPPPRRRRSYRGISLFLKGPVNPVAIPTVRVITPAHTKRRGQVHIFKGPITPVPVPPKVVSPPHKAGRGRLVLLRGVTPAQPVPLAPVLVVTPTHTKRRGIVRLFQGPINPVPVPPQVVSKPHRGRIGRLVLLRGPVNPVPTPPKVVSRPPPPRRGRLVFLRGPTPVTTAKAPPPIVSLPHRGRRGRLVLLRGPVNPVPVPHQVVSKPPPPRRGRRLFFRGPTPVATSTPVPTTIVSKVFHRLLRGRLFFHQGPVGPPPSPIPTTYTAAPPQPWWVTGAPVDAWSAAEPPPGDWVTGWPTTAWSASQAFFVPIDIDQPGPDWQTGGPRP